MKYRLVVSLLVYLILYTLSLTAAFLLRFDLEIDARKSAAALYESLPLVLLVKATIFTVFSSEWQRRHRYTTLNDIASIVTTATFSSIILDAAYLIGLVDHKPDAICDRDRLDADDSRDGGLLRATIRFWRRKFPVSSGRSHVKLRAVVYGADSKSIAILRALQSVKSEYKVVALSWICRATRPSR